jgi:hypothetical protein
MEGKGGGEVVTADKSGKKKEKTDKSGKKKEKKDDGTETLKGGGSTHSAMTGKGGGKVGTTATFRPLWGRDTDKRAVSTVLLELVPVGA